MGSGMEQSLPSFTPYSVTQDKASNFLKALLPHSRNKNLPPWMAVRLIWHDVHSQYLERDSLSTLAVVWMGSLDLHSSLLGKEAGKLSTMFSTGLCN